MKIPPEEIRKRASRIACDAVCKTNAFVERQVIQLIEDATGEKIPEPTELHGSVWANRHSRVVILQDFGCDLYVGQYFPDDTSINRGSYYGGGCGDFSERSEAEMIDRLSKFGYSRIGDYDFSKGLPEGAK